MGLIWKVYDDDKLAAEATAMCKHLATQPTRALGLITGARVASSPWPFDRSPDARLEVRIEEFLPLETGTFRLSGQYFVGAFDGSERARARSFAIAVPFDPAGGVPAIAAARGAATVQLAETIARDGLR